MFLPSNITLQFGDSGDYVAELQRRLVSRQCLQRSMITSFYDGPTVSAVRTFQIASGLQASGVAGPETLRRLNGFFNEGEESGTFGSSEDNEQGSSIKPTPDQYMTEMMKDADLAKQQELEQRLAVDTHTAAAGQDVQADIAAKQARELEQQRNLAKEQQLAREQTQQKDQVQQQQVGLQTERMQQFFAVEKDQQAFIDKPMAKSIDDMAKPDPNKQLEQEVGGQGRGPMLGLGPAEGKKPPEAEKEKKPDISIPKTEKEPEKAPEKAAEKKPELAAANRAQGLAVLSPDMSRITQQMESRLPAHVIEEVKQVGVVMLSQGVKQTQMPGEMVGPERTPGMEERQVAVGGGRGM